jgi:hypothetical protein
LSRFAGDRGEGPDASARPDHPIGTLEVKLSALDSELAISLTTLETTKRLAAHGGKTFNRVRTN